MKKLEISLLALMFILVSIGIYLAFTDATYFKEVYVREDGVIESGTAIALLGASGIFFWRFAKLRNLKPKRFLVGCLFMGLVFLFGAGEEISWGQRILGLETPEMFRKHNAQKETNLHNLKVGKVKINKLIFGTTLAVCVVLYLAVLPLVARKVPAVQRLVDSWAIPLPRWHHILCYVILALAVSIVPSSKKGELLEFGGCILFFLITLYPANQQALLATRQERA